MYKYIIQWNTFHERCFVARQTILYNSREQNSSANTKIPEIIDVDR